MVAQARALAVHKRLGWTVSLAALMAFCSPYPIRFSIEGKSYALLVLFVALAWWWRNQGRLVPYALAVALASLTHFYGLFLLVAAGAWDGSRRRWGLCLAAGLGVIPALAWIAYASDYLFSSKAGSWIGGPSFALLEDTLARGLGVWPLPKLALLLLTLVILRRWGGLKPVRWLDVDLLDRTGVIPSGLDGGWGGADLFLQAPRLWSLFRCADSGSCACLGSSAWRCSVESRGALVRWRCFDDGDRQLVGARVC
jgi:hypothetical protein